MAAYYNEHDAKAAAWLRELIARNLIAPGEVDERSIVAVRPDELSGFTQCHFFAGIGVWSYALRGAGWPDDRPVWTGSCPCQPFSDTGKRRGYDDPRHLWPAWFRLIGERRPDVCFGEQVASGLGLAWLDVVSADLEGAGYAIGSADLCAAGVGAPHRRQRLYWVADAEGQRHSRTATARHAPRRRTELAGQVGGLANADGRHASTEGLQRGGEHGQRPANRSAGFWSACDWLPCTDGKTRPIEPGSFPLVTGAPARVGRLRGYGNAIVAPLAAAFVEAYLDVRGAA